MKEIRVALLGTGIIAHGHAQDYQRIENVKIVAACDINEPKLTAFCDKYGIEDRYTNYKEMLKRDDIDLVSVAVHNNLHAPLSIEVMRSGKHCYCEKPMAGSYHDANKMKQVSIETGKTLHIQLGTLYDELVHASKKVIEAGLLGNIYHARSYGFRRRGRPFVDGYAEKEFNSKYWASGGALYDMGVYHISQMLYLLGLPEIERISGQVYQELDMDEKRRKEGGFNVEELGVGLVKFKGNLTMDILESWAVHANEFPPSEIFGSKGGLSLTRPLTFLTETVGYPTTTTFDMGAEVYRSHQLDPSLVLFDNSKAHLVGALRGQCELIPTKEIALQTMLVSEGIFRSGAVGHEVSAQEVIEKSEPCYIKEQDVGFTTFNYTL
jgi:Predicted dehydrogenases and related proteins